MREAVHEAGLCFGLAVAQTCLLVGITQKFLSFTFPTVVSFALPFLPGGVGSSFLGH